MCVEFELSCSSSFRDTRGPKFTLGGAVTPARPLAEKISYPRSTWPTEMCAEFQLSSSSSFRDMS